MAEFGETFVLDMGEPVRIVDLVAGTPSSSGCRMCRSTSPVCGPGRSCTKPCSASVSSGCPPSTRPSRPPGRGRCPATSTGSLDKLYAAAADGDDELIRTCSANWCRTTARTTAWRPHRCRGDASLRPSRHGEPVPGRVLMRGLCAHRRRAGGTDLRGAMDSRHPDRGRGGQLTVAGRHHAGCQGNGRARLRGVRRHRLAGAHPRRVVPSGPGGHPGCLLVRPRPAGDGGRAQPGSWWPAGGRLAGNEPRRPCCAPGPGCCCGPSCSSTRRCGGASSEAGRRCTPRSAASAPPRVPGATVMLAGPGGIGKSTLVHGECSAGRRAPATTFA